ncbi:hypothetical protein D3C87_976980 [compost metagenome]
MFDFIPLSSYTFIYYQTMLIASLLVLLHSLIFDVRDRKSLDFFSTFGGLLLILLVLYIGFRPISGRYFGDTGTYAQGYSLMKAGKAEITNDYVFNYFMLLCSKIMPVKHFFFLCAILYLLPCYVFSKKYFKKYWFFSFFMLIGSFSFWAYGVNGIRNGLGTSLFLFALCYYKKKMWMYALFILSFLTHSSLIIPLAAFIISGIYKNPKIYLYIWLFAIPLSLAGGSVWQSLFFGLGLEDRTAGYATGEQVEGSFSASGFRWDFVFYSSFGIMAGIYFIFKKKITDVFYTHLFGTYTIANAFWILVITANYSNRFAYLSWFLMAPVIAYPMLRYKLWDDHYKTMGVVIWIYFMFTYLMYMK